MVFDCGWVGQLHDRSQVALGRVRLVAMTDAAPISAVALAVAKGAKVAMRN